MMRRAMSAPMTADDPTEKDDPELVLLVARFASRVRVVASRVQRRWALPEACRDDLISAGYLGLLKALQNRRPEAHEYELSAYVSRRIEGAVVDEARGLLGRAARVSSMDPSVLDEEHTRRDVEGAWRGGQATADPEEQAERAGRRARIDGCLSALDEGARALVLGVASGRSIAELARDSGATTGQLQNQLARATRVLRGQAPELRRLLREEI